LSKAASGRRNSAKELGEGYSTLVRLRNTGDYGRAEHVPHDKASQAVDTAATILRTVAQANPSDFTLSDVDNAGE